MQNNQNYDFENISNSLNVDINKELDIEEDIMNKHLDKIMFIEYIKSKKKKIFYLTSSVVCVITGFVSFLYQRDEHDESINELDIAPANLVNNNIKEVKSIEVINEDVKNLPKTRIKDDLTNSNGLQENEKDEVKESSIENTVIENNIEENKKEENKKEENYFYNLEEKINPSSQENTSPISPVLNQPMTSNSITNAMRYWNYFEYYGNTYGVDPYLLVAISCQESRGDHLTTIPGGKYYNGAGYGIMQIEKPGKVTKKITAYNHITKTYDTMFINSENDVYNIENNIKAGAMIFAQRAKEQQYNPYVTIQGYNYGTSGIKYAVSYYVADGNINRVEEIYGNGKGEHLLYYIAINNSDWVNKPTSSTLTAREWYSSEGWKKFGAGRGDKNYIENIMRFYTGPEKPYIIKDTGEKISF